MRSVIVLLIVLGLATTGDAGDRCAAGKMKGATRAAGGETKCRAKATSAGGSSTTCLGREEARLTKAFAKAESRPPCRTVGDVSAIDALVDAFVDEVFAQVAPGTTGGTCAAAKLASASRAAVSMAKCHVKAIERGEVVDAACVIKAETKLGSAFIKAEAGGSCPTTGDASLVRDALVAFMSALATRLLPPLEGCAGQCVHGSYCEIAPCAAPVCYPPDAPYSLVNCGGITDPCCGFGYCVGDSFCDPGTLPSCTGACQGPDEPLSQVVCGGALPGGCGIGTCTGGAYCDACQCYSDTSPVSLALCGCGQTGSASTFQKVYWRGANGYNHATAGLQTADQGYLMAGYNNFQHPNVIRTDPTGEIVWAKRYPNTLCEAVVATPDGFVLTGSVKTQATQPRVGRLTRIDANGNVIWSRTFAGTGRAVRTTSSGGFVVAGQVDDDASDALLFETDAAGNFLWGKTYGTPGIERIRSVVASGGGYLLLGATTGVGNGADDLLLIRTDAVGTMLWAKSIGGTGADATFGENSFRMIPTSDGGFAIASATNSFGQGNMDVFVVKLDQNGDVTWATAVGGAGAEQANAIAERPSGGYFVMGVEHSFVFGIALLALEADGTLDWARTYGYDGFFNYLDGGLASDGGAYIVTESHHFPIVPNTLNHWYYLLKTDSDGRTRGCCGPTDVPLIATPVSVAAVPQTLDPTSLTAPLLVDSLAPEPAVLERLTVCESSAEYLCRGILTGQCPCGG